MADDSRMRNLRIALILVGVIFIFGIYPLMLIWPSGWTWHTGHSDYPLMIVGIYATLGVFLIMAGGHRNRCVNEIRRRGASGWFRLLAFRPRIVVHRKLLQVVRAR